MALFTVQPATFGLHEGVEIVTLVEALERDTRTVERVRILVRGAAVNLMTLATQLTCMVGATRKGVPRRHLHGAPRRTTVDVQSTPDLGRCVQQRRGCEPGVQPQASRPRMTLSRYVGGRCVTDASSAVTHFCMRLVNLCPSRTWQDYGIWFFPVPCP